MNISSLPSNRENLIRYLTLCYHCTGDEVRAALKAPENAEELRQAEARRSFVYYPGDKIAKRLGWKETDFDPDEEIEEEE